MSRQLIRTDKNGTKYFHVVEPCGKCQGNGYIQYYHWNEGGICFDCNGSGFLEYEEKEYTEEYLKKLEERRRKAQEKKDAKRRAEAEELNKGFYDRNGFNADGKAYVVLGNSFDIKDELKKAGFFFKPIIGWYSPEKIDGFDCMEISVDDVYNRDNCGVLLWNSNKRRFFFNGEEIEGDVDYCDRWEFNVPYMVKQENAKRNQKDSVSGYLGNVGDKIEVEVTLKCTTYWDTDFGTTYLHVMEDKDGNVLTWKTNNGSFMFLPKGEEYYKYIDTDYPFTIKGKVKDHTEYKGVKQTVLTRCSFFSEHLTKS